MEQLRHGGALPALLSMIRQAAPALVTAFAPVGAALGTPAEGAAVRRAYDGLASSSFSADVLATLAGLGIRPAWADRVVMTA